MKLRIQLAMLALMTAVAIPMMAQTQAPPQPPLQNAAPDPNYTGDAPDHAVARISLIQGNVSVRRGDDGEMTAAVQNAPVVVNDQLVTGGGARAEAQLDASSLVRLASSSEVRFSDLQYKRYQLQVAAGTVTFRSLRDSDAQIEISTPSVSFRPLRQGIYRITVQPDGTSQITVRAGEAEAFSPQGSERIPAGSTMMARGSGANPEIQMTAAIPDDDWDRWNAGRDRELQNSVSSRYVSPDVYGTEQLDNSGDWVNDPAYGNVWAPRVAADWAPYRDGRWVWVDFYGWTWVSDDPWGWAPYHYGSWFIGARGWCWYPGPIGARYYWRPALVSFFGWGGGGIGVGFGFGHVGWVPLAPYERYHPWYGRNGYVGGRTVNVVNNVNITNVYRNARVSGAVTSMRSGDFGHAGVNSANFVRANSADLTRAGAVNGAMPFSPSQASRRYSDRAVSTQGMPAPAASNRFYSRPANSASGAPQVNGSSTWRRMDQSANARSSSVPSQQQAPANRSGGSSDGWQRFDSNRAASQRSAPQSGSQYQGRSYSTPQSSPEQQRYSAPASTPARSYQQQQQPIQMRPSIVRDRATPSGGGYSRSDSHAGNFGGAHASAPSHAPSGGGSHSGGGGGHGRR